MPMRIPQTRVVEAEPVFTIDPATGGTANAAAPTYVEGATGQPLSLNLHGAERVLLTTPAGVDVDPTATVNVSQDTAIMKNGNTSLTPKFVKISTSSSSDILALVAA